MKHVSQYLIGLVLVVGLWGWPKLVYAQTAVDTQLKLGQVEQSLQDSVARQSTIASDLDAAIRTQDEISLKLIALGKTLDGQFQAVAASDDRMQKLETEAILIRSELGAKQDVLSELLAGLQRLEQNPPPALVVAPVDILEALRGAMMFGAVVPDMRAQAEALQSQLVRLAAIREETEVEKKTQQDVVVALQGSQLELHKLQEQKKAVALTAAKDLDAEKNRSLILAEEAKSLKQLLVALAADEAARAKQKTVLEKSRQEAEKLRQAALAGPSMVFSMSKGRIEYPVQGDIVKQYGDDNGLGRPLDGVVVATQAGLHVISPVDAKVEFAGAFRSYGQLLILNAGEGYLVLLAGMAHISAEVGQSVKAGEPVGDMGTGPSSVALMSGIRNNARPVLYVEFRKNSEPVDPSPWWVGGRKEAMK